MAQFDVMGMLFGEIGIFRHGQVRYAAKGRQGPVRILLQNLVAIVFIHCREIAYWQGDLFVTIAR